MTGYTQILHAKKAAEAGMRMVSRAMQVGKPDLAAQILDALDRKGCHITDDRKVKIGLKIKA